MAHPSSRRPSQRRPRGLLALVLAAFVLTAPAAFAADAPPNPKITAKACRLPHFEGQIETSMEPPDCSTGRCQRAFDVELLTHDRTIVYGVKTSIGRGDPPPPSLGCAGRYLVLRWRGQSLRLELEPEHEGLLKIAAADERRINELWRSPAARTPKELAAHVAVRALLELAYTGPFGINPAVLEGMDDNTIALAELVVIRDQLRGGDLQFVGGAPRKLRMPFETGGAPELFFRGPELCVVEVASETSTPASAGAPPRMRCFAPGAKEAREPEPFVAPASGSAGTRLSAATSTEGAHLAERALVSPDQRWVVAQIGKAGGTLSLWVFPTARATE